MNKKEIIKYLITGIIVTLINWLTYAIFIQWFNVTNSNILSWLVTVVIAFILNKFWVFESKKQNKQILFKEISLFFTSRIFSGIIETIGLNLLCLTFLGNKVLGVKGLLAKIIMSAVSMILNYIISKLIIFKYKNELE